MTDLAGNVSQDIEYEYNVSLIADYNTDGFIDAVDLTTLVQGWTNKDLSYELGPTTGEVPNLKPANWMVSSIFGCSCSDSHVALESK